MQSVIEQVLSADVATAGTITFNYPAGTVESMFVDGKDNYLLAMGGKFTDPESITIALGTTSAVVTYNGTTTIPQGTTVRLNLDAPGKAEDLISRSDDGTEVINGVAVANLLRIDLGTPIVADVDGIATVDTTAGAEDMTLDGARVTGGVATLDVPRNVTLTGATTDHSAVTATITGTDVYGNAMVETMACPNNSTVSGKKAFKTVTTVAVDGAIATNGISVGFGDVLGLPVYLGQTGLMLADLEDGAAVTDGTFVAGLATGTASTATTADVRGTYDPNSAADGAKTFTLYTIVNDPTFLGNTQYSG